MAASYYSILEVLDTASIEVIKGAYKHLAQKWHPDKNPDNRVFATRRTAELTEAYRVLSDIALRERYDESLKSARQSKAGSQYASASSHQSSGKTGENTASATSEPRAASSPNAASENRLDERTAEPKKSKTLWDYCFGASFVGFLLFIPVGLVFQHSFSGTSFWVTYAGVSLIAGFLWKHDFLSKNSNSGVHDFADDVRGSDMKPQKKQVVFILSTISALIAFAGGVITFFFR